MMLIPLDGSKTAEKVLPYARALAHRLKTPVELINVIDIGAMAIQVSAERARYLDSLVEEGTEHRRIPQGYCQELS
jgi:nucleotide-binding universal stress UspA family protein